MTLLPPKPLTFFLTAALALAFTLSTLAPVESVSGCPIPDAAPVGCEVSGR